MQENISVGTICMIIQKTKRLLNPEFPICCSAKNCLNIVLIDNEKKKIYNSFEFGPVAQLGERSDRF